MNNSNGINATIKAQSQPSRYTNAVALCVDKNYLPYATFVALQIQRIETQPVDICICVPTLEEIPDSILSLPICFVAIDVQGIQSLPTDHLSVAAYYRLFLPKLFATQYEHIIYLDADVYIRKPFVQSMMDALSEQTYAVAAAPYMGEIELLAFEKLSNTKIQSYLQRYHNHDHLYRNSGVLVFNVSEFNKTHALNKILQTALDHPNQLESHDQSALNLALLEEIAFLPLSFNWQLNLFSSVVTDDIDPYIIHFVNVNKPWQTQTDFIKPFISEYEQFLKFHFSNINFNPTTLEQQRRAHTKYSGLEEVFSQKWHSYKINRKQAKQKAFYEKHKEAILGAIRRINEYQH